jgi:tRNA A-37 threonylcarbamoyl transferase component Bud32
MIGHKRVYKDRKKLLSWTGLTLEQIFDLELEVYKRVGNYDNFPTLISYDKSKTELIIEDCGASLDKIKTPFKIPNLEQQIDNIVSVLKEHNIVHLDLELNNICYKDGKIYMIDFERVVVDGKYLTNVLKNALNAFQSKWTTKSKLEHILKKYK